MATRSQISFVSTVVAVLRRAAGFSRALKQRRELRRLADLDDRMLADIGLTRHNLISALAEPLSVDASESLAAMARQANKPSPRALLAADQRLPMGSRQAA